MATVSILGLYQYDKTIFDGFKIPEQVDRDMLISNLLTELTEFEVLYPNTDFMKMIIEVWSGKELPIWKKLLETTQYEYNPIYNFDRTEEYTDEKESTTVSEGTLENHGTDTENRYGAGFNSTDPVFTNKIEQTAGSGNSSTGNIDNSERLKHKARLYGNIGVTTTQQMIESEREVVKFNIMDYIIDSFKKRFCILIY